MEWKESRDLEETETQVEDDAQTTEQEWENDKQEH